MILMQQHLQQQQQQAQEHQKAHQESQQQMQQLVQGLSPDDQAGKTLCLLKIIIHDITIPLKMAYWKLRHTRGTTYITFGFATYFILLRPLRKISTLDWR